MAIKSFKDKITSLASGEILGGADDNKSSVPQKKKESSNLKKKNNNSKVKKNYKSNLKKQKKDNVQNRRNNTGNSLKRKENEKSFDTKEKSQSVSKPVREAVDGYQDVLSILGIKENINLDVDFESKDLDYIEFSQTTPLGFDFDEVADFISRTKYTLNKLETTLKQRNRDLILVASEVKKVEQRMIENNQARELEKMIGGMTEEERLIEENMNLKIEINELKNKLITTGSSTNTSQFNREIETLKAENEMLRMETFNQSNEKEKTTNKEITSEGLPSLSKDNQNSKENIPMPDLEDEDSVDNMIKLMGGMYDDE